MHERGSADVLRFEEVRTPTPGPVDVLLKVHAATVNHTDLFHRSGRFLIQKPLPHILGMDVAGVEDSVFKRPFSFPMAPRTRHPPHVSRSSKGG